MGVSRKIWWISGRMTRTQRWLAGRRRAFGCVEHRIRVGQGEALAADRQTVRLAPRAQRLLRPRGDIPVDVADRVPELLELPLHAQRVVLRLLVHLRLLRRRRR